MNTKRFLIAALIALAFTAPLRAHDSDAENLEVRLFFGLSTPQGGVPLRDWRDFVQNEIAPTFPGFTLTDSLGYYRGQPERAKVFTLLLPAEDFPKVEALAKSYAKRFDQKSVMLVMNPVHDWRFIGAD